MSCTFAAELEAVGKLFEAMRVAMIAISDGRRRSRYRHHHLPDLIQVIQRALDSFFSPFGQCCFDVFLDVSTSLGVTREVSRSHKEFRFSWRLAAKSGTACPPDFPVASRVARQAESKASASCLSSASIYFLREIILYHSGLFHRFGTSTRKLAISR